MSEECESGSISPELLSLRGECLLEDWISTVVRDLWNSWHGLSSG